MEPETLTRAATVNSTQRSPAPYRYPLASLILTDAVLAWRNVLRLPSIIFPLHTNNPRGELYLWSSGNIVTIIVHSLLTVVGVLGFGLLGLWLQLPGFMWLLDMACYATVVWVLAWFLNMGKEGTLITSNPEIAQEVAGEKWVFVNGVMCGRWWMQSAMDELARRFGRPVDGVHNRT